MRENGIDSPKFSASVALVESNWSGHHPTYFKEFMAALIGNGCEVLAICPRPDEVRKFLAQRGLGGLAECLPWSAPKYPVWPRRFAGLVNEWMDFLWLGHVLRETEVTRGEPIDLVFFSCLYELARIPRSFRWSWSGLLLHCRVFRMPGTPVPYTHITPQTWRLLSHPRMTSIATLDEGAVSFLTRLSGGKPAVSFPDFTDDSPPAEGGVGEKLRQFAAGRAVVGCLGHLQPTKGVATLAQVALNPENQHIVFAFVGSLLRGVFTAEEQRLLDAMAARPNVFTHFESLRTESDFNAVVKACDLLFAAYQDFPHSSNILAKAALLQKPVIVSDGYLMAERVRYFQLGEIVPERDAVAAAGAIRKILTDVSAWCRERLPRWSAYADEHSVARLVPAFEGILANSSQAEFHGRQTKSLAPTVR